MVDKGLCNVEHEDFFQPVSMNMEIIFSGYNILWLWAPVILTLPWLMFSYLRDVGTFSKITKVNMEEWSQVFYELNTGNWI